MGTTVRGYPYPEPGVTADVPYWQQQGLEAVDADVEDLVARVVALEQLRFYKTSGSTDAGGILTVNHQLGAAPTYVVASPRGATTAILQLLKWDLIVDATTIKVRCWRTDSNAAFAGQPIVFDIMARP